MEQEENNLRACSYKKLKLKEKKPSISYIVYGKN
jgi:hypothetical protein